VIARKTMLAAAATDPPRVAQSISYSRSRLADRLPPVHVSNTTRLLAKFAVSILTYDILTIDHAWQGIILDGFCETLRLTGMSSPQGVIAASAQFARNRG